MEEKSKFRELIHIAVDGEKIEGELIIPKQAKSLVIFSHGSGSSRLSPRNNYVAGVLHENRTGTFLLDLLTEKEDEVYANRFNIDLLTQRLIIATKHLSRHSVCLELDFGYFGASTGAASAIKAAAALPNTIHAVVSRGGRPDLAESAITELKAATLLIVGELDYEVLELNRKVYQQMNCSKKLEVVKGATHLFEEPGTLKEVAFLAADWFSKYLLPVEKFQKTR
jgi:putative phosphoribosyl transferase